MNMTEDRGYAMMVNAGVDMLMLNSYKTIA